MQIFNIIRIDVKFIINVNETGCNYLLKCFYLLTYLFLPIIFARDFKFYSMSSNRRGIKRNKFCDNFYGTAVRCKIVQFA